MFQLFNRLCLCAEGEYIEECDDTASPNDESPSKNGDSDVDRNYSVMIHIQTVLIATVLHCMR